MYDMYIYCTQNSIGMYVCMHVSMYASYCWKIYIQYVLTLMPCIHTYCIYIHRHAPLLLEEIFFSNYSILSIFILIHGQTRLLLSLFLLLIFLLIFFPVFLAVLGLVLLFALFLLVFSRFVFLFIFFMACLVLFFLWSLFVLIAVAATATVITVFRSTWVWWCMYVICFMYVCMREECIWNRSLLIYLHTDTYLLLLLSPLLIPSSPGTSPLGCWSIFSSSSLSTVCHWRDLSSFA